MRFSIALIITLLLYDRVIRSDGSFLSEESLSNDENDFRKFFDNVKTAAKSYVRHMVILGASNQQLDFVVPSLKAYPHIVGRNAKEIGKSEAIIKETFVVYFLASLNEEYIKQVIGELINLQKSLLIFVFEGTANDSDIEMVFDMTLKSSTSQILLLNRDKTVLKLYRYFLQENCSRRVGLIDDWIHKSNWNRLFNELKNVTKLRGCPVTVCTIDSDSPLINFMEDKNGTLKINGGVEGNIILTLAQKMNYTPLVQRLNASLYYKSGSNISRKLTSSCSPKEPVIGIGQIRPRDADLSFFEISKPYKEECFAWCVPRMIESKGHIITSEFSWGTWGAIGFTFLAKFAVENIVQNIRRPNEGIVRRPEYIRIILDIVGSTLGNPIIYKPLSMGGNILLISYLAYSTVITTAYKASLASILPLGNDKSLIVDLEGIIKANLTTGGSLNALAILQDQKDENELIPELIKRFVVEPNVSRALKRITEDKNFAYLIQRGKLNYYHGITLRARMPISFDVLDGCVLAHNTVAVFPKGSFLTNHFNSLILRLSDNGILNYWKKNDSVDSGRMSFEQVQYSGIFNTEEALLVLSREKFYNIFVIYCICMAFCIVVFLGELIVHKYKTAGRVQRSQNLRQPKRNRCMLL